MPRNFIGDKLGGRSHVQWDQGASATPNAQLAFFAEFLATTGVYDAWLNSCSLIYNSPNAPSKRDVLGTWLLAILAGHKRYAHITAPDCAVTPSAHKFKLRQSAGVKKWLTRLFTRKDWSTPGPSDQGWSAVEAVHPLWRWCTTGGVGIAEQQSRGHGCGPSPVEHCCWQAWGGRSNMLDRPPCI